MSNKESIASFTNFTTRFPTQKSLVEGLYLPALIESYSRVSLIEDISTKSENQIRNDFERDLRNRNTLISHIIKKNTIFLNTEGQILTETEIFRTDIKFSFYERENFVVECKKLSSAEARYVQGHFDTKSGEYVFDGVERFTANIYSEDDTSACMLSFIVNPNVQRIMEALIERIRSFNFVAGQEALLSTRCVEYIHSFQSKHTRKGNSEIHLYHLLFGLNAEVNNHQ